MTRPTSVKVGGQKYKIRYDYIDDEAHGLCDPDNNTIHIFPNMQADKEFKVLIHEIAHAVIDESLLRDRKRFDEEQVCDIIAIHFMEMLKSNPILIELLMKGETE